MGGIRVANVNRSTSKTWQRDKQGEHLQVHRRRYPSRMGCQPAKAVPAIPPPPGAIPEAVTPDPDVARLTQISDEDMETAARLFDDIAVLTQSAELIYDETDCKAWQSRNTRRKGLYSYIAESMSQNLAPATLLEVLSDPRARKTWDDDSLSFEVLQHNEIDGTEDYEDVIYWVVSGGLFFTDRDYLFHRRIKIDRKTNTILIYSQNAEIPYQVTADHPEFEGRIRVGDYKQIVKLECVQERDPGTALIDARSGCRAYMQYSEDPRTDVPDSMVNMAVKAMLPANQRKSTSAAHELQKTKPKPVVLKDPPVFGEDTVAVEPSGPPPFEPGSLAPLKASLSDLKAADVQCEDLDQDAYGGRWCRC